MLLAVPNVSEGRDVAAVRRIAGPDALDVSTDPDHNRTVVWYGAPAGALLETCVSMVERAVAELDLRRHAGVHPRFGVVDVLPFVPHDDPMDAARAVAREAASRITARTGVACELYGEGRSLPEVRASLRAQPPPDARSGVVCVGARGPLVAFNINLRTDPATARAIAAAVRAPGAVRALGLELASRGLAQVSMNLVDPYRTGPKAVFDRVAESGQTIVDCEVIGLVPRAILPELDGLPLRAPARSIEDALGG